MSKLRVVMFITCVLRGQMFSQQDTTVVPDSTLLKQIEQQMQSTAQTTQSTAQPRSAISTNPNMSVIGDFQGYYHRKTSRNFDVDLHEAEFAFQSFVDPYARADFFLSLARNPSTGNFTADIEQAYLTTLDLPEDLQLKVGRFRMALGRINPTHPHALPFIDLPNAYVNYFGEEGLNDEGFSLSWLVPNQLDFYQELTLEVTNTPRESPSFMRSDSTNKYLYLLHLKWIKLMTTIWLQIPHKTQILFLFISMKKATKMNQILLLLLLQQHHLFLPFPNQEEERKR